ncbi:MAG TPA: hypothetical protein VFY55_09465 [Nitrososphaeraceae archaeon]|nr:hypothetical protein [Nitrososphaeraceae archaeon]
MKIRVNFGLLILFGIFVISSIMLNPVLAQIPTMTGVGVKIDIPSDSVSVPVGDLTIYGASSDNNTTNCQVYADWNDLKPMQIVTANGPKGDADYSKWSYTYNGDYHDIVEGSNELTSKITCYDQVQKATSSKSYSINVTGTKGGSEIVNNTGNQSTVSEDTKLLPVKSSSSINDESSDDTVEKSNESTYSNSEDSSVIPVKNILPLYSESNEESIKSASTEDADETKVASAGTVELQDEPTSKEIIDSDSETYATVSSKQQGEIGESNTIDMSESETAKASDEGLTSHSESNTFFTFEPDLVADEFSDNDEKIVGTSSNTDSSVSNHDSDDNSIFGLKFNGLEDATKNKIEKKIEKLEDKIADRVQLFDLIG